VIFQVQGESLGEKNEKPHSEPRSFKMGQVWA